jgi:hypothetical protein
MTVWSDWTTTDGGETFIAPEPPEAPPAPPALPKNITPLQAIGLCQSAGGMTDALLVAADGNANLAAAWIKFRFAQEVERDNALTLEFLDALHALGYMPNGKDAVIAAWPTV